MLFMIQKITVKISPNQIFTIFVVEMGTKFNKFILEGWKCMCWMAIDNTNNKRFARLKTKPDNTTCSTINAKAEPVCC